MFGKIGFILTALPKIVAVVMLVEDLLDPTTPGEEKKAMALDFLEKQGIPTHLLSVAGSLIDLVVSVLHSFGIIQRSKKPEERPAVQPAALAPEAKAVRVERESQHATDDAFDAFVDKTSR